MKRLFITTLLLAFFFSCKEKPSNPAAEYGDRMMNAYQKGKQAGEEANLDALKKAIQAYHASNDKYPQDLEEIIPLLGGAVIDLSEYDYNPQNGAVTLKTK